MVTPGCCCWYRAKAWAKNGATNVDPAPVRVGGWPPGPALATASADAEVPGGLVLVVLVHAATATRMIAAAAQMAGCAVWRGWGPGRARCSGIVAPLLRMRSGLVPPGSPDPGLGAELDRVPGAAERRGVGQVQVADRLDGHGVEDRGGGHVDPLGDLGGPVLEQLHAQQAAARPVASEPHVDAV